MVGREPCNTYFCITNIKVIMKLREVVAGALIVILSALIGVGIGKATHNTLFLFLVYAALAVFYLLFVTRKLPENFYKYEKLGKSAKISIGVAIFMLVTICIWGFTGVKLIARIGFIAFLFSSVGLFFYAFFKMISNNLRFSDIYPYLWNYARCILIIIPVFPTGIFLGYSCESRYTNNQLTYKLVRDGLDSWETTYNDSLNIYQTEVYINESNPETHYIIYYDQYPDKVSHIDTIGIDSEPD